MRLKGDICEENVIYLNKMRRKWQRIAVMCRNWQYIAVLKKLLDSEYKMKGWTTSALGRCGSRLEKWWETLEQFSQIVTNSLIELAEIKPDQQVLDIATGIGEPALSVAKLVGENGKVTATDMSSQMLSIARDRASSLGLHNVEFQESDAEKLDFPESHFDAIVCRWGLMFLPDVETTLKSALRRLVPNG